MQWTLWRHADWALLYSCTIGLATMNLTENKDSKIINAEFQGRHGKAWGSKLAWKDIKHRIYPLVFNKLFIND